MSLLLSVGPRCAPSIRKPSASTTPKRNGSVWRRRPMPSLGVSPIPPRGLPHQPARCHLRRHQPLIVAPAPDLTARPHPTDRTCGGSPSRERRPLDRSPPRRVRRQRVPPGRPRAPSTGSMGKAGGRILLPGSRNAVRPRPNSPIPRCGRPTHPFRNGANRTIVIAIGRPPPGNHAYRHVALAQSARRSCSLRPTGEGMTAGLPSACVPCCAPR